jgi:hypothetical protein
MFGKGSGAKKPHELFMNRKETSLWLGRAMSTSEVTLRSVLQLLSVIAFQQKAIQALYDQLQSGTAEFLTSPPALREALAPLNNGASQDILKKLAELEEQLKPVLEIVDQACAQLEKEI